MPQLTQVGAILAKIETTPGVDATPTNPTDFIQAIDAQFNPDFQLIERNYMRPSLSRTPHIMGRQLATISFTTEMFATGVAAAATDATTQAQATPKWADLFEGCGYSGAVVSSPAGKVYSPLTSSQKTLTIYCYYDGMLHKLTGCMGTFTMNADAGQIATFQWNFTGVYNAPTATATPSPTFSTVDPPLVESCSFVIGSTAASVFINGKISFEVQNNVIPRPDTNSSKGFNSMYITGRNPQIMVSPEAVLEASHPFWTDFAAAGKKAASFVVGSTAGNKMTFTAANTQISALTYSDRDGIRVYEATLACISTTSTGNDEALFKFL